MIDPGSVKAHPTRTVPLVTGRTLGQLLLGASVFCAIFFLAGELFLRMVFWDGMSFSAHRGPIVQQLEKDFRFNRFDGPSRGPEPSGPKHPQATRIVIQGDSITWGQGVRKEENLFSSRLLTSLQETTGHVDMAVLARPGREIDEHLQQLNKWGHELQPDVIIYQWYINDIELDKKDRPRTDRLWRHPEFVYSMLQKNSYFWFFLDFSLDTLLPSPALSYERYLSNHFKEGSHGWQMFEQQFSDWVKSAKELTPHVVVALYPHLALTQGVAPFMRPEIAEIHTRMLALCSANNLVCVDLSPALTKFEDARSIKVSPFDDHPSAEVHGVIAKALYDEIVRSGLVKVRN